MQSEYRTLRDIINREEYKLNEQGVVVWRSAMDAGAFDPNIGRHISDYISDWFMENGQKRITDIERSLVQQQFPMTPDEAVKKMEEIEFTHKTLNEIMKEEKREYELNKE